MKYKVNLKEKNKLSENIIQLIFSLEDEYNFYTGQWIDFFINIDNKEYIGGYSIVSTPLDKGIIELAIKYSNKHKVTNYLHDFAKEGEIFYISEAQGDIYFDPLINKDITLIAGGIGITPLLSMLRYANQIKYNHKFNILYTAKDNKGLVYKENIESIISENNLFKADYFITDKDSDQFTGRIDKDILKKYFNDNTIFFLCGPKQMIDEINNNLLEIGVKKENILYEKWW